MIASPRFVRSQQQEGPERVTDGLKGRFVGSRNPFNTQKTMFRLKEWTDSIHSHSRSRKGGDYLCLCAIQGGIVSQVSHGLKLKSSECFIDKHCILTTMQEKITGNEQTLTVFRKPKIPPDAKIDAIFNRLSGISLQSLCVSISVIPWKESDQIRDETVLELGHIIPFMVMPVQC